MKEKRCSECEEVKSVGRFQKDKSRRDGYRSQCKECCNKWKKERYQKDSGKMNARRREKHKENPEKDREYARERYKKNPEKFKEWNRIRYCKNPKKWNEKSKEYRKKNLKRAREISARNQIKYKESWAKYFRTKYTDPKCQICEKDLGFFTGNINTSVNWDHNNGKNEEIKKPIMWLRSRFCTEKNISIWESCNFGMLCNRCNFFLPTDNRKLWLEKITQYIKGV